LINLIKFNILKYYSFILKILKFSKFWFRQKIARLPVNFPIEALPEVPYQWAASPNYLFVWIRICGILEFSEFLAWIKNWQEFKKYNYLINLIKFNILKYYCNYSPLKLVQRINGINGFFGWIFCWQNEN